MSEFVRLNTKDCVFIIQNWSIFCDKAVPIPLSEKATTMSLNMLAEVLVGTGVCTDQIPCD